MTDAKINSEFKELRKIWTGFWPSRVLLTANNLGIFEHLETKKTASEISKLLKCDKRATEIMLDALTGIGLLKKSGSSFSNTSLANRFLVKKNSYYQGDIISHANALWQNWSDLDSVIKTGKPARSAKDHAAFIKGMHNISVLKADKVIKAIDLKGVKKALDLGGGPGTYCIEFSKRGISATLFDLPETVKIARGIIKNTKAKQIKLLGGDFFTDDIGSGYDLIFISQVLHAFSEENCMLIIKKAKEALNAGGKIVIQEFYIDKNRTHPASSALFSINMLVNTVGGRCYAPSEMRQWLSMAGLKKISSKLLDDIVLISADKI